MPDLCQQCSIEVWGEDNKDFAGLCKEGECIGVLCEGCGITIIDYNGKCQSQVCLKEHKHFGINDFPNELPMEDFFE